MDFPCRKIVGACVIVLMALGSVAPRQLTHAHIHLAGGERLVSSHGEHSHPHPHDHHDHDHHHGHSHPALVDGTPLAYGFHTHLFVLGVEVVLPEMPFGDQERPDDSTDSSLCVASLVADETAYQSSPHPPMLRDCFVVAWNPPCPTTDKGNIRRDTARLSAPLCDIARHERSGVLVL